LIGIVQNKSATLTLGIPTFITRFTFPRKSMSNNIKALATWTNDRF
jgi:hypothetical protein